MSNHNVGKWFNPKGSNSEGSNSTNSNDSPQTRSSLERPSFPLNNYLDDSEDGFDIGEDENNSQLSNFNGHGAHRALSISTVYRAASLLSRTIAKLSIQVMKKTGENKEEDFSHPASMLFVRPNEYMTWFSFYQTICLHEALHGNAYAVIYRNEFFEPESLIVASPLSTFPLWWTGDDGVSSLWYVTSFEKDGTNQYMKFRPTDILHFKNMGYDGYMGYSPVELASGDLRRVRNMNDNASSFFKNSSRPSVVLCTPQVMTPDKATQVKNEFEKMHRGSNNAYRTAVMHSGLEPKNLTINARDSQFLEQRQFEIREIANWFNVPPHKIGDTARAGYNSLEQENQSHLDDNLDPYLVSHEQEFQLKLLTEKQIQSRKWAIIHNRKGLVRADLAARAQYYNLGIMGGWLNQDEARGDDDRNPIPDGKGKNFLVPLNMGTMGADGKILAPQSQDTNPKDANPKPDDPKNPPKDTSPKRSAEIDAVLRDAFRRCCKRLGQQAGKLIRGNNLDLTPLSTHNLTSVTESLAPACALAGLDASKMAMRMILDTTRIYSTETPKTDFDSLNDQFSEQYPEDLLKELS